MNQEHASATDRPTNDESRFPTGARVLVVGRSEAVMELILSELAALEVEATGTTAPGSAADEFDARDFDLIAIGRGLSWEAGKTLKALFLERNSKVRLLDVDAPFAVHQINSALNGGAPMPNLQAYCRRIGYTGPLEPTLQVLQGVIERHPDAIPFEAIDVLLGRGVDIAPQTVESKLVDDRRGGYCFEQNGLLKRVLEAIGFHVDGLGARVRWNAKPGSAPQPYSHMALRVTLDGTPWLVDVGFGGNVLTIPVRMDTSEPQTNGQETFRLIPLGAGLLLQTQIGGQWRALYELSTEPRVESDYEMANWHTSAHPDSQFRKHLMVARTTPAARYRLLNGRLTVRHANGAVHQEQLDADGIERVLRDTFLLPVESGWRPMMERAATQPAEPE